MRLTCRGCLPFIFAVFSSTRGFTDIQPDELQLKLIELRTNYSPAIVLLRKASDNCMLAGHLKEDVRLKEGDLQSRLDSPFLIKRSQTMGLVEYTSRRGGYYVHVYTNDLAIVLQGPDRMHLAIRQYGSDAESLRRSLIATQSRVLAYADAAYRLYDVTLEDVLDGKICVIDSLRAVDDNPGLLRLEFHFLDPLFYQDAGYAIIDTRHGFVIMEYEVSNWYEQDKATLTVSGSVSYQTRDAPNSANRSDDIEGHLASLLPRTVDLTFLTRLDDGGIYKIEKRYAAFDQVEAGTVKESDFSSAAYGLPDVSADNLIKLDYRRDDIWFRWVIVILNLTVIGFFVIMFIIRRSAKRA